MLFCIVVRLSVAYWPKGRSFLPLLFYSKMTLSPECYSYWGALSEAGETQKTRLILMTHDIDEISAGGLNVSHDRGDRRARGGKTQKQLFFCDADMGVEYRFDTTVIHAAGP